MLGFVYTSILFQWLLSDGCYLEKYLFWNVLVQSWDVAKCNQSAYLFLPHQTFFVLIFYYKVPGVHAISLFSSMLSV
jgi:hypothetical protein